MPGRFFRSGARIIHLYLSITPVLLALAIAVVLLTGKDLGLFFAQQQLSSYLGTRVSFASFRFLRPNLIELRGLCLGELHDDDLYAQVRKAHVALDWRELLRAEIRIRDIDLEGWMIRLRSQEQDDREANGWLGTFPTLELPRILLSNGLVLAETGGRAWHVRNVTVEGLVRLDSSQSSIRIRELGFQLPGGSAVRGEASLWRLGRGAWKAEFGLQCQGGAMVGTAVQADGTWEWSLNSRRVDLASWIASLLPPDAGLTGLATFAGKGTGAEGTGVLWLADPGWDGLSADSLQAELVLREGALVAENMIIHRGAGRLTGATGLVFGDEGTRVWSNVTVDSLRVPVPDPAGGEAILSGEIYATFGAGPGRGFRLGLHRGDVSWKTWRLTGIDAEIAGEGHKVHLQELSIAGGTVRGTAHGEIGPGMMVLEHDLHVSLRPTLRPWTGEKMGGELQLTGVLRSTERLQWQGRIYLANGAYGVWKLAHAAYHGIMYHGYGGAGVDGSFFAERIDHAGSRIAAIVAAGLEMDNGRMAIPRAAILRPNGALLLGKGRDRGEFLELERLSILSSAGGAELAGPVQVRLHGGKASIGRIRLCATDGGWIDARDIILAPWPEAGTMALEEFPLRMVTSMLGLEGSYDGRISAMVTAGEESKGWARLEGVRRLPAMEKFPTDIEVRMHGDSTRTTFDDVVVTQEDLTMRATGWFDLDGRIHGEVQCEDAPISQVLVLVDELLGAGLRPIFDSQVGKVSARVAVDGTWQSPLLEGQMVIGGDAEIVVRPIRSTFHDVRAFATLEGHELRIDHVTGRSGQGMARLSGTITMPGLRLEDIVFDITASSQQFNIIQGIYGLYDADLELGKQGLGIRLEGDVRLLEGRIDLPALIEAPVPPPTSASLDDQWMIAVTADRGVWARDRFLNAEVAGRVVLTKEDGIVSLQGELELLRGTYRYLDRKFELEQGTVTFLGGPLIEPVMNVTGSTIIRSGRPEGEDVELFLHVTGTAMNPELDIRSDADDQYTEEQMMAMLLFNLTPEEIGTLWEGDVFAKEAAGTVEEFLAGELARALRAQTGLDEFEVSSELLAREEKDFYVRMGKYLSRDIFVSVGVRSLDVDDIKIEYILDRLTRRLGISRRVDIKLVGERAQDEYSGTSSQVELKLRYKF